MVRRIPNVVYLCIRIRGVSEIRDGEDLWQWSRLEIRLNAFRWSTIPQKQFTIIIIIIIIMDGSFLKPDNRFEPPISLQLSMLVSIWPIRLLKRREYNSMHWWKELPARLSRLRILLVHLSLRTRSEWVHLLKLLFGLIFRASILQHF